MQKTTFLLIFFCFLSMNGIAQKKPITIEEKRENNRIFFYAINENLQDIDVVLTVTGIGFKQRGGVERPVRVPATSRVQIKSIIKERDKYPMYEYTLQTTDSLSRRALRPAAEKIKINPYTPILMYSTTACKQCDTISKSLTAGPYLFKTMHLSEKPNVAEVLKRAIPTIDTISTPIMSLGGALYTDIVTYSALLEKLKELELEGK
ncbi:hypothetical protein [Rasiella sp. SM2506]|uniref:hypothetical protein n=1 Tax=Rasiella sp. SM2506 TaxID=3423914 RepID=UPI003D7AF0D7